MMNRTFSQALVERSASRLAGTGLTRRKFLARTAVVGSALAVAPRRFMLEPVTAYAATIGTVCGPASDCASGYTAFCCTINNGVNQCPPGSFAGGWWRADRSGWCCGGSRYIIDCQSECTGCGCAPGTSICSDACQNCTHGCNPGPTCDRRHVCINRFRYGQCNQQVGCSGDVLCRMVTCTPPWQIPSLACASTPAMADNATAEHGAPCLQQGSWQGGAEAIRSDGVLAAAPAIVEVKGSARRDAFVLGTDSKIYWATSAGSGWGPWTLIGGPPVGAIGAPAAVSWSPGRIDVMVRGGDNKLWQAFTVNGGASWSSWIKPVGNEGVLASNPSVVSWAPGRLDVFVVGTDGQVFHRFYENGWSGVWEARGGPAAGIIGDPAAAAWAPGRIDVFVTGKDSRLYQSFYSNGWSGWIQPPGTENGVLGSAPGVASWSVNHLAVFARSPNNGLVWATYFQGYWSGWARIGRDSDLFTARPSAASRGCQQIDVLVRGTDALCYQFTYSG